MSEKIELPNGETMTPRKRECDYDKYEHPSYGKVSISRVNSTGSKLSADDLATLFSLCDQLSQEVESNLPYFAETLNKHVDNLITEAGHEVETVVNDKLLSMGLEALKASLPQLTFDNQGEE